MQITTGGTLNGKAGTASAVTYTISGDRKASSVDSYEILGQGQLPSSTGALLTTSPVASSTQLLISKILLTNTTGNNVTGVTFYVNGTAAANMVWQGSIPANGSAIYDSEGWKVYDSNGVQQYVGSTGPSSTISVGTVTNVGSSGPPTVTNVGTPTAAVFNFGLQQGATGSTGAPGVVQTVTAGDTTLTAGGTSTDPTLKVSTTYDGTVVHKTGNETVAGTKTFSAAPTLSSGETFTGGSAPSYVQGKLVYDTDNESLTFFNNDSAISLQVGQEEWTRVINKTGSTIANGAAVYINGADATTKLPTIALAKADSQTTLPAIGLATESIPNSTVGYVTTLGVVHGIDTSAFSAGAVVYVSAATAGVLTSTVPTGTNLRQRVGIVIVSNASTGSIQVQTGGFNPLATTTTPGNQSANDKLKEDNMY